MKNEDRKVYTVFGSEDGMLGVYTNVKLAYDKCLEYLSNEEVITSYSQALKICKNWGGTIESKSYVHCRIEVFHLNN